MKPTDPRRVTNEQAIPGINDRKDLAEDQESFPENGYESLTEADTDSSDLETEPLDDEDNSL